MQPETAEWGQIAEEDFETASREQGVAGKPNFAAVCFHAQQSEKYLKALLVERNAYFPKTHNLVMLAKRLERAKIDLAPVNEELQRLSPFGIDVRYPGGRPNAGAAKQALADCTSIRSLLRRLLQLPE